MLDRPAFLLLLILLSSVPLLPLSTLPFADLGGHLGRYAVQLDGGASPVLRQWYSFDWGLLPNLGCDLLMQILGPLVGVESAAKLIVTAIVCLHVTGVLLLSRAAHGRVSPTALFAIPLAYGLPLQYGFVNFALSIALALLALALWLHLGNRGRVRMRAALFAMLGAVLWVCHIVGWAVFCIGAFADGVARAEKAGRPWWEAVVRAGLSLLPLAIAPAIGFAFATGGAPERVINYDQLAWKIAWLIAALCDRWMLWDKASVVLIVILIGWFWRSASFVRHRGLALAAILLLAVYAVMPTTLMGSCFADMRLAPIVLTLFLVAAQPSSVSRRLVGLLTLAGLLFAGARLAGNAVSLSLFDAQFRQSLAVLDDVPFGANLLTFDVHSCANDDRWDFDRRTHISGYALVRRHAFDNQQWAIPGGQLLKVHNPAARPFELDPNKKIWDRPCGERMGVADALQIISPAIDYIWVIGAPAPIGQDAWRTVSASGDSRLLRRIRPMAKARTSPLS